MNAEAFTLKARRTTRVPLRVPVKIEVMEGDKPKELDGWTIIVNIHGAKIECKRKAALGETIKVTVAVTRKSQSGNVVWSNESPNMAGNYEFAVELTEPGNLWGVGFPPSDWKEVKMNAGPVAVESKVSTSAEANQPAASASVTGAPEGLAMHAAPKRITVAGYEPQPIIPFAIGKPSPLDTPINGPIAAPEPTPEFADTPVTVALSEDASPLTETALESQCPTHQAAIPEMQLVDESLQLQGELNSFCNAGAAAIASADSAEMGAEQKEWMSTRSSEETAVPTPLPMELLFTGEADVAASIGLPTMEAGQPQVDPVEAVEVISAASALIIEPTRTEVQMIAAEGVVTICEASEPTAIAETSSSTSTADMLTTSTPSEMYMRDRMDTIEKSFGVLLEATEEALQAKCESMIERMNARLEAKLAEMESATLERLDTKLNGAAEDHYERLDKHSESLMASRRVDFEQVLAQFCEATDETARNRQQETVSRMDQDLRRRASELTLYTQGQLQGYATEAAENAQSAMAAKLQDLLTMIDQEVGDKCRSQTEQIHLIHRAQFEGMLSSRIEEARSYWQSQMDEMQESACRSIAVSLEGHIEQQNKKQMQQMDQSLAQVAAQIQKTFFKHVVAELSKQQQGWMARLSAEMGAISSENINRVRQELVQFFGIMGEALARNGQQAQPSGTPTLVTEDLEESDQLVDAEA